MCGHPGIFRGERCPACGSVSGERRVVQTQEIAYFVRVKSDEFVTLDELYVVVTRDASRAMAEAERYVRETWPKRANVMAKLAYRTDSESGVVGRLV